MKKQVLSVALTICVCTCYAQIEVNPIDPPKLEGAFTLYWEISNQYFIGEQIIIQKKKSFEYQVFAWVPGQPTSLAQQTIVSGKFQVNGDTLLLFPTKTPRSFGPEIFNLKLKYLIRAIEIINPQGTNRIIQCLIKINNPESLNHILELMPAHIEKYQLGKDLLIVRSNDIGVETEVLFYEERIFIQDILQTQKKRSKKKPNNVTFTPTR